MGLWLLRPAAVATLGAALGDLARTPAVYVMVVQDLVTLLGANRRAYEAAYPTTTEPVVSREAQIYDLAALLMNRTAPMNFALAWEEARRLGYNTWPAATREEDVLLSAIDGAVLALYACAGRVKSSELYPNVRRTAIA